jgi:hypothetical protein
MTEDMAIIMLVLRDRRKWITIDLDLDFLLPDQQAALRIKLARINAEIARRCLSL